MEIVTFHELKYHESIGEKVKNGKLNMSRVIQGEDGWNANGSRYEKSDD